VQHIEFGWNKRVQLPTGYARIEFEKAADATQAQRLMNGSQIDGQEVKVEFVDKHQEAARHPASRSHAPSSPPLPSQRQNSVSR